MQRPRASLQNRASPFKRRKKKTEKGFLGFKRAGSTLHSDAAGLAVSFRLAISFFWTIALSYYVGSSSGFDSSQVILIFMFVRKMVGNENKIQFGSEKVCRMWSVCGSTLCCVTFYDLFPFLRREMFMFSISESGKCVWLRRKCS